MRRVGHPVDMRIPCYQVDAFTRTRFAGNPAAVCPLTRWLPDATLQAIAAENNLAETAFTVPEGEDFHLRWFTPAVEVDLCGHATLAAAFVLMTEQEPGRAAVRFRSQSGPLAVRRDGDAYTLDFPARAPVPADSPAGLAAALGCAPREVLRSRDWLVVLESAAAVAAVRPDFAALTRVEAAVIVTGPGDAPGVDFVSRFFAPGLGIPEDPVTGSAHCTLAPYWAGRLGRTQLHARQISRRGGEIRCTLRGDRVDLTGGAVLVRTGEFLLDDPA
jgi:PhzF family phenazine biosynthesis protein